MNEIYVALISLAISTMVSVTFNVLVYYQNMRKHYSTTISKERMEWIKETRKIVAAFLGFCDRPQNLNDAELNEFYKLKNEILLNLNSNEDKYTHDACIRNLLINHSFEEIRDNSSYIREAFVNIFKNEWDKAKLEAGRNIKQVMDLEQKNKELTEYFVSRSESTSQNCSSKNI